MLDLSNLQDDVASLPEDAQQLIFDFVVFLKQRHRKNEVSCPAPIGFEDQPFIGMWSNRSDTQDSVAWVRQLRQQQWQR